MRLVGSDLDFLKDAIRLAQNSEDTFCQSVRSFDLTSPLSEWPLRTPAIPKDPSNPWMTLASHFFKIYAYPKPHRGVEFVPLSPGDPHYRRHVEKNFILFADNKPTQTGRPDRSDPADFLLMHPSVSALLRAYDVVEGVPEPSGGFLQSEDGGAPNWCKIEENAAEALGIALRAEDAQDAPLLATDSFGRLLLSEHGRAQLVSEDGLIEANAERPIDSAIAVRARAPFPRYLSRNLRSSTTRNADEANHENDGGWAAPGEVWRAHGEIVETLKCQLPAREHELSGHADHRSMDDAESETGEDRAFDWNGETIFLAASLHLEMRLTCAAFLEVGGLDQSEHGHDPSGALDETGQPLPQALEALLVECAAQTEPRFFPVATPEQAAPDRADEKDDPSDGSD